MKQPNQLRMMHIPAGEGTSLSETAVVKLGSQDTQGVYVLMEERLPPQATIESAAHGGQTSFYVVEGYFAWYRQGQTTHQTQAMASPGDILHFPAQEAWTGQNVGKTTGTLLAVVLPAGTSASFRHIKAGEGDALAVLTDVGTFKLTEADTLGAYILMQWRVPPQGGAVLHAQRGQETFYILEGNFAFHGTTAQAPVLAKAGDLIHIPDRVPHGYHNVGQTPGTFLTLMVPAGKARQFFEEIGAPWTDRSAFPPPQLPDPAKLQDIVRKYQVELFPPS